MSALRAFWGGAIASAVLFLPWLFLMANFLRWKSSDRIIEVSYGTIIILWFIGPIAAFTLVGAYITLTGIAFGLWAQRGDILFVSFTVGVLGVSAVWIEFVMWNKARRWVSGTNGDDAPYLPGRVLSLPRRHLVPFANALLWSIVTPILLFVGTYGMIQAA